MFMKSTKTFLFALALAFSPAAVISTLHAADSLGALVEQHGLSWIIGKWEAKTENGDALKVEYEWCLDKHAIRVKFSMPDRETEGLIGLKPGTSEAMYVGLDSKGGGTMGKWVEFNDHPTLKVKHKSADDQENSMASEHVKVDDDTMKVILHKVDDAGEIDSAALVEITFTRKK
jgi:hypothetical protein